MKLKKVNFSCLRLTEPPRTKKYPKNYILFQVFHANRCSRPRNDFLQILQTQGATRLKKSFKIHHVTQNLRKSSTNLKFKFLHFSKHFILNVLGIIHKMHMWPHETLTFYVKTTLDNILGGCKEVFWVWRTFGLKRTRWHYSYSGIHFSKSGSRTFMVCVELFWREL